MSEWYNDEKLTKYAPDAIINFIIGQRRIGKTFFYQKKAIEDFEKYGTQTLWLRNRKTEFEPPFIEDFLNGMRSINVGTDPGYIAKPTGLYLNGDLAIKFQSLSTFSNIRGNAYPNINMIVFDEFCPEDRRYTKNCHTGLMSITKTILSGKQDAKVYCLSNYISVANPYFVGFNIYPHEKFDVTNFKDKNVAIEVCRGYKCAIESDNPWNKVYSAGGYQAYGEANEDELWTLISKAPQSGYRFNYYVRCDGETYGFEVSNEMIWVHKCAPDKNNPGMTYGCTLQDCNNTVYPMSNEFKRQVKGWVDSNILRYADANTMFVILKIVYSDV